MTVLVITTEGKRIETDAIANGTPVPKLHKLVVGSGTPPISIEGQIALTSLVHLEYESNVLVVDRLSPTSVKFTGSVPENIECNIREIGLTLEDGTLFAYSPYMPANPDNPGGGMYKGRGFAWTVFTILSREQMGTLNFTYSPIDVQQLAEQIATDARASIDLYLQAYFISIAANVSGLSSNVQKLQSQINTLIH